MPQQSTAIPPVATAPAAAPRGVEAASAGPSRSPTEGAGGSGTVPSAAPPAPNPRLSLDAATGLVVIEFRSGGGRVGQSFPTPKEMDAYRRNAALGGPEPKV